MKYILTSDSGQVYGPFSTADQFDGGYTCDNAIYYTVTTGNVIKSEVSDDYETQSQKDIYNQSQSDKRSEAYKAESDPIFFQYQRGIKTQQDWLDAVTSIQNRYPYKV